LTSPKTVHQTAPCLKPSFVYLVLFCTSVYVHLGGGVVVRSHLKVNSTACLLNIFGRLPETGRCRHRRQTLTSFCTCICVGHSPRIRKYNTRQIVFILLQATLGAHSPTVCFAVSVLVTRCPTFFQIVLYGYFLNKSQIISQCSFPLPSSDTMACAIAADGNVCKVCEDIKEDQRDKEYYNAQQEKWYKDFLADASNEQFRNCDIGKVKVSPASQPQACEQCEEGLTCQPCLWRATFMGFPCMEEVRAPDASTRRYSFVKHRLAKKAKLARRIHDNRRQMLIPYMPNCSWCEDYDNSYFTADMNFCSVCGARNPRVVFKTDL
jgi:hypothetical protein